MMAQLAMILESTSNEPLQCLQCSAQSLISYILYYKAKCLCVPSSRERLVNRLTYPCQITLGCSINFS